MENRYRMYPDEGAVQVMRDLHCAHARYVWNLCVEQQSWWRPGRGSAPGNAERQRQLAQARQAEPWLRGGSSSVQQQALRDYDRALAAFFDPENPAGKPGYRSKRRMQGFVIRDVRARRISRKQGEVFIPKCGRVRFRWSRPLPGRLGMARVTLDRAGRWHVSFPALQTPVERNPEPRPAVGIDRGVRTALVMSDGQHYRAPRISDRDTERYLALQQKHARQQPGSKGREKTRQQMAAINARVSDRRKDWAEKLPARLVRDHDVIVFEQQCHACGHVASASRESQAVYRCVKCSHEDHADTNAARNILARGLTAAAGWPVPAHAPGHRGSRPRKPAQAAAGTTRNAA